jgi:hypothetical protein
MKALKHKNDKIDNNNNSIQFFILKFYNNNNNNIQYIQSDSELLYNT